MTILNNHPNKSLLRQPLRVLIKQTKRKLCGKKEVTLKHN